MSHLNCKTTITSIQSYGETTSTVIQMFHIIQTEQFFIFTSISFALPEYQSK
jgi:hypothetical protein